MSKDKNGNGNGEVKAKDAAPTGAPIDLKASFSAISKLGKESAEVKAKLESIERKRSDEIKKVYESKGKGPYRVDGRQLLIVHRGDTYFFRGEKTVDAIEV